ncbi:outer membrane protein assembly factor BamE [Cognatiluteimonas weifangensis]|uniref:Outer membrane protein assembly factor BamE n=1 Tax=Cognatiluteimonas weifangensis TaxID=2303539 RepID=A0A372DP93_9GAMM|nr:outer membrane protein assembly factor BamE [Luteimonas weifangensis]RFP61247.1 outer membrane protein assembly factor BamE [Luteimonas weifangensis]
MRQLPLPLTLAALVALSTAGCGILYKQPIYQGNLMEQTAVEQLQAGMSMQQVQALLGTPSIADPFHHDRWDYTASERTDRLGHIEVKTFTVWFDNGVVSRWEGEYFPEQDQALAVRMAQYGNLSKDDKKKGR